MTANSSRVAAKVLIAGALIATSGVASSQTTFTLVDHPSLVNHWPGIDGLIGSSDDVVSPDPSPSSFSATNSTGTASYNAFDFGLGAIPDADRFPPDRQAITFLDAGGTVTIDMNVAENGGGPLILGWDISGSEPFPGHGAYSAQVTAVNSGSFNPGNHVFSQNINFRANLLSGEANSSNFDFSGNAYVILASEFGTPTGNNYVDSTLIPIAQAMNADGMVFAMGSGTVPAADNSGFPQMGVTAALFGLMTNAAAEPLPQVDIMLSGDGQSVILSWPTSANQAVLESTMTPGNQAEWIAHSPPYALVDERATFTYTIADDRRFFRLRSP